VEFGGIWQVQRDIANGAAVAGWGHTRCGGVYVAAAGYAGLGMIINDDLENNLILTLNYYRIRIV